MPMTSPSQPSFTKEELWILDLFASPKGRTISRKVLLGLWESGHSKDGVVGLRQAVKSLQDRKVLKVAVDGSLSLEEQAPSV